MLSRDEVSKILQFDALDRGEELDRINGLNRFVRDLEKFMKKRRASLKAGRQVSPASDPATKVLLETAKILGV